MDLLEIQNLSKSYKNKLILNDINFECKVGEILGVFGRNGTGKSTLLKIIFGILKADSVLLKLNSKIIHPKEIIPLKMIGYLSQETFLPKGLIVRDVIPLFFSDGEKQDKIFYSPKVSSFEKNKVGNLSLGELRYLELLIMGNLQHPFLLLDEPFSMVEPIYKEKIKELLLELKKSKGIILTDHYYNDVLDVSDKNFLIKDAQKITIKNKEDLVNHKYLNSNT
jgi:ABC-type multidrug transport system ATPase subunit